MVSNTSSNFVWGEIEQNLLISLQVLASLKQGEKIRVYDDAGCLLAKDDRWRITRWMSDNGEISVVKIDGIMKRCFLISRITVADSAFLSKVEELNSLYVPALQGIDTLRKTYLAAGNLKSSGTLNVNLSAHYLDSVSIITKRNLIYIADLYPPEAPPLTLPSGTEPNCPVTQKNERNEGVAAKMTSTLQPNEKVKKLMAQGDNRSPQYQPTVGTIVDARSQLRPVSPIKRIHIDTSSFGAAFKSAKEKLSHPQEQHESTGSLDRGSTSEFGETLASRMRGAREPDSESEGELNVWEWDQAV